MASPDAPRQHSSERASRATSKTESISSWAKPSQGTAAEAERGMDGDQSTGQGDRQLADAFSRYLEYDNRFAEYCKAHPGSSVPAPPEGDGTTAICEQKRLGAGKIVAVEPPSSRKSLRDSGPKQWRFVAVAPPVPPPGSSSFQSARQTILDSRQGPRDAPGLTATSTTATSGAGGRSTLTTRGTTRGSSRNPQTAGSQANMFDLGSTTAPPGGIPMEDTAAEGGAVGPSGGPPVESAADTTTPNLLLTVTTTSGPLRETPVQDFLQYDPKKVFSHNPRANQTDQMRQRLASSYLGAAKMSVVGTPSNDLLGEATRGSTSLALESSIRGMRSSSIVQTIPSLALTAMSMGESVSGAFPATTTSAPGTTPPLTGQTIQDNLIEGGHTAFALQDDKLVRMLEQGFGFPAAPMAKRKAEVLGRQELMPEELSEDAKGQMLAVREVMGRTMTTRQRELSRPTTQGRARTNAMAPEPPLTAPGATRRAQVKKEDEERQLKVKLRQLRELTEVNLERLQRERKERQAANDAREQLLLDRGRQPPLGIVGPPDTTSTTDQDIEAADIDGSDAGAARGVVKFVEGDSKKNQGTSKKKAPASVGPGKEAVQAGSGTPLQQKVRPSTQQQVSLEQSSQQSREVQQQGTAAGTGRAMKPKPPHIITDPAPSSVPPTPPSSQATPAVVQLATGSGEQQQQSGPSLQQLDFPSSMSSPSRAASRTSFKSNKSITTQASTVTTAGQQPSGRKRKKPPPPVIRYAHPTKQLDPLRRVLYSGLCHTLKEEFNITGQEEVLDHWDRLDVADDDEYLQQVYRRAHPFEEEVKLADALPTAMKMTVRLASPTPVGMPVLIDVEQGVPETQVSAAAATKAALNALNDGTKQEGGAHGVSKRAKAGSVAKRRTPHGRPSPRLGAESFKKPATEPVGESQFTLEPIPLEAQRRQQQQQCIERQRNVAATHKKHLQDQEEADKRNRVTSFGSRSMSKGSVAGRDTVHSLAVARKPTLQSSSMTITVSPVDSEGKKGATTYGGSVSKELQDRGGSNTGSLSAGRQLDSALDALPPTPSYSHTQSTAKLEKLKQEHVNAVHQLAQLGLVISP